MAFKRSNTLVWKYWLLTDGLLIAGLAGWSPGFLPVMILCGIQVLHFLYRERRIAAFPVQVRIAFLGLLIVGQWGPMTFILWLQAAGTTVELLFDYCTLARLMALMPWNRNKPLSPALIGRVLFSAPVNGSVLTLVKSEEGAA